MGYYLSGISGFNYFPHLWDTKWHQEGLVGLCLGGPGPLLQAKNVTLKSVTGLGGSWPPLGDARGLLFEGPRAPLSAQKACYLGPSVLYGSQNPK